LFGHRGNGRRVAVKLRLVGEKSQKFFAERGRETLEIFFVRFLDKPLGHGGVQNIHVRVGNALVQRMILFGALAAL